MKTDLFSATYSLLEIDAVVQEFWDSFHGYHLMAFSAEMGGGKTTFISHLCHYLNVQDAVSSPTFALVNEYHFTNDAQKDVTIYHIDLYRIKDTAEAINAGMEDCLGQTRQPDVYCFVEWPEKAPELLLKPYLLVQIETGEGDRRNMTVSLMR
jgi:tRNA threonylcarbamoyladenosine biosynthesis protein TsaE